MIFGNRLIIEAELELLSDLHVGSGRTEKLAPLDGDEEDQKTECALVQRDADNQPLIPSTSLKGGLRAAVRGLSEPELAGLFGEISEHEKGKGQIGRLWIEPARWLGAAADEEGSRLAPASRCCADGFKRTRVAIDRQRGAAADRLLFTEEVVAKGARFGFRVMFLLQRARDLDEHGERLLVKVLAPLAQGLALGRDTRQGQGVSRLKENTLKATYKRIDGKIGDLVDASDGGLASRLMRAARSEPLSDPGASSWQLDLIADTPFISIADPRAKVEDEGAGKTYTAPLERDGKPLLWPSSLLGAVRARAGWLVECERLRAEGTGRDAGRFDGAAAPPVMKHAGDAASLSSIDRLFGIAGWRGEVSIDRLEPKAPAARQPWTAVSIDRFTGGGRDSLLYKTETFIEPSFAVTLRHRPRAQGLSPEQEQADRDLLDLLVEDLADNGLMLGHGAAKGFGWFDVKETASPERAA